MPSPVPPPRERVLPFRCGCDSVVIAISIYVTRKQ
nr:MAG TPA: MgtA leader peptide [Inoviridae sp.]